MNFLDGHLYPENQQPLIITAAPYAPGWIARPTFPEDIPVTMEEQIQKAVDCYEAGATVLHLHVREADGKGSKRLSMFNELIAGVRKAVPEMIIQVGGSISFAPEGPDGEAKWLSDDTRHMLADLDPGARPGDGDRQHHPDERDGARRRRRLRGVSRGFPHLHTPTRTWWCPRTPVGGRAHAPPHRRRHPERLPVLQHQQLRVGRALIRRGFYKGPLVMNWVAISGGMDHANIYSLANLLRAVPDGAVVTVESSCATCCPINMIGHRGSACTCAAAPRTCLWNQRRTGKMPAPVDQIEAAGAHFRRSSAAPSPPRKQAREICRIGVFYDTAEGQPGRQRLRAQPQRRQPGLPAQDAVRR
jgi:hypothetical protein